MADAHDEGRLEWFSRALLNCQSYWVLPLHRPKTRYWIEFEIRSHTKNRGTRNVHIQPYSEKRWQVLIYRVCLAPTGHYFAMLTCKFQWCPILRVMVSTPEFINTCTDVMIKLIFLVIFFHLSRSFRVRTINTSWIIFLKYLPHNYHRWVYITSEISY